jgi:hypothetical protein
MHVSSSSLILKNGLFAHKSPFAVNYVAQWPINFSFSKTIQNLNLREFNRQIVRIRSAAAAARLRG